jgi:hypothetical protein
VGDVSVIVVHTTQGSFKGAVSWFENPASKVSAHYTISKTGEIVQSVKEQDIAWHVGSQNSYTIGIEHEGFVDDPAWVTDAMRKASAKLTCYLLKKWKLQPTKTNIKGHVELPKQTHSDPGKYWPWDVYLAEVKACYDGLPDLPDPPVGCCAQKVPAGGELVLDNSGNDCAQLLGPQDSWWTDGSAGSGGSMQFTYTSAKSVKENYARWRLTFAAAGSYKVQVWIPGKNASAKPTYVIKAAGKTFSKVVDQKAYTDAWVDLGTYTFAADCDEYVEVADNTGQAYDVNIKLGVDALRVVASGAATSCGDCDDQNPCTNDGCSNGQCTHTPNTGAVCWDGDACTAGETCQSGVCKGGTVVKACDDGNPCTKDACSGGVCTKTALAGSCDDGNSCTTTDTCTGGVCVGKGQNCDDANPCTTDVCAPSGCAHLATDSLCNDKNPCTKDVCDAKSGCQFILQSGVSCDDGSDCTQGDICTSGLCKGTGSPCYDDNPCTLDTCASGICQFVQLTGACDDGDACTEGDYCAQGVCLSGKSPNCDDGLPCTVDSCSGGACKHVGGVAVTVTCLDNKVVTSSPCGDKPTVVACSDNEICQNGACLMVGSDGDVIEPGPDSYSDTNQGDAPAGKDSQAGLDVAFGDAFVPGVGTGNNAAPSSGCQASTGNGRATPAAPWVLLAAAAGLLYGARRRRA